MSWSSLLRKRLPAPWVPTVRGPFDTTFFDEQYAEDEEAPIRTVDAKGMTYNDLVKMLPSDWDKEFDEPVTRGNKQRSTTATATTAPAAGSSVGSVTAPVAVELAVPVLSVPAPTSTSVDAAKTPRSSPVKATVVSGENDSRHCASDDNDAMWEVEHNG
jgi:hypothetical protein